MIEMPPTPSVKKSTLNKVKFWIAFRLLFSKSIVKQGAAQLAFIGLVLGVASLVAAMAVMSGFEDTLKRSLTDVTGHIQIVRRGILNEEWNSFSKKIKALEPKIETMMRFAYAEAVLAHKGQVSGVLFQGVESQEMKNVLRLDNRIRSGQIHIDGDQVVVGMGLAKRFQLQVGDSIYVVVPLSTPFEEKAFRRQAKQFKITGVMDFGKNEWNERLLLGELKSLQALTEVGNRYTGAFAKLHDLEEAQRVSYDLSQKLGPQFSVSNWFDVNGTLFEAVRLERVIIFLVVYVIIFVAAFNISSTLYVFIRQRYADIAILKTLGLSSKDVRNIFVGQGVLVGVFGTLCGFILGFILCFGFMFLQSQFSLISGSVYKIDQIEVHIRLIDLFSIGVSSIVLCCAATLAPAIRGSRLEVVEGLKNG